MSGPADGQAEGGAALLYGTGASSGEPVSPPRGVPAPRTVIAPVAAGTPPTRGQLAWFSFARAVLLGPSWLMWRISVQGLEHVPQTTPYVIAPVHRSYLDSLFATCVTRRRVRFMAKEEMWSKPWLARLLTSLGVFPVRLRGQSGTDERRGTPDRQALRNCQAALAGGEPVVMFPEGTRRSGTVVQPLFNGPAFVATRMNVPIVPVGIGGSERAMPRGAKWLRPGKVVVIVGKPIWPPVYAGGAPVPRRDVPEMTARLRAGLQELFDEARQRAGEP